MHLSIFYNWTGIASMVYSGTDSSLKDILILSTSTEPSLERTVKHGAQSPSTQVTFTNQGIVPKGVGWFLVEFLKQRKITSSKVHFSIEIQMKAKEILEMYQMWFKIEFIYWDADNIQA